MGDLIKNTKQQRIQQAKASNTRERNIAKQYFNSGPSISNLARAAYHYWNSVPGFGGEDESGNLFEEGSSKSSTSSMINLPLVFNKAVNTVRERLYNNIVPGGYEDYLLRAYNAVVRNKKDNYKNKNPKLTNERIRGFRDNIFAEYLQIPEEKRHGYKTFPVVDSKYRPTQGAEDVQYKTVKFWKDSAPDGDKADMRDMVWRWVYKDASSLDIGKNKNSNALNFLFGPHTVGRGYDKKGEYMSFADTWDLSPIKGYRSNGFDESFGIGKPVHFYDRMYLDDYFDVPEATHSTYLPEVKITGNKKKYGGNIIPLSKKINDIRYGLPIVGGLSVYSIDKKKQGGQIIKKFKQKFQFGGKYTYNWKNSSIKTSYGYPVCWSNNVPKEYKWVTDFLKNNPSTTGMAVGGGAQGDWDTGPRVIIRNSNSNIITNPNDSRWNGLDKIEAVRHYMNETNYNPYFKISPEQEFFRRTNFSKDHPYNTDDDAWRQSIVSRIMADDMEGTPEQMKIVDKFEKDFYKGRSFGVQ